jgi:hypothetical protein
MPKASNTHDKRYYARLISTQGGYINVWAKADDEKASKMVSTLKANTTYEFANVGLHEDNVIVYGNSSVSIK